MVHTKWTIALRGTWLSVLHPNPPPISLWLTSQPCTSQQNTTQPSLWSGLGFGSAPPLHFDGPINSGVFNSFGCPNPSSSKPVFCFYWQRGKNGLLSEWLDSPFLFSFYPCIVRPVRWLPLQKYYFVLFIGIYFAEMNTVVVLYLSLFSPLASLLCVYLVVSM